MDDLTTEVIVPEGEYESPEEEHVKKSQGNRSNFPLAPPVFKGKNQIPADYIRMVCNCSLYHTCHTHNVYNPVLF